MVSRVYTYRIERPNEPEKLAVGMGAAAELVRKHNKWVQEIKLQLDGGDILLILTASGHDQWWIKKRIIYPLAAILVKSGLKLKDARLQAVERLPDKRITRPRASDGASTPDPDKMISHDDMMQA